MNTDAAASRQYNHNIVVPQPPAPDWGNMAQQDGEGGKSDACKRALSMSAQTDIRITFKVTAVIDPCKACCTEARL